MDLFNISKPLVIYFICPALTAISRYLFNVFVSIMPSFLDSSALLSPSRYGLSLIYLFVSFLHIAFNLSKKFFILILSLAFAMFISSLKKLL